ncbi:MCE family protein [Actinomadura algeriensis]|uniref:Virulence factor Mce-like protein n=1 Tax=Actinomadura algeriensis TaxID=1679523 RepID=A0ABR9K1F4_9ACTN|nr:MlaD family protein [Actinomadura algeriensis]MBE1536679.1 virulence factor Mce-like protein [Actinomadura algeriensis]
MTGDTTERTTGRATRRAMGATMGRPRSATALVTAALVLALSSCNVLTGPFSSSGSYHVTAYFVRAVSFYPGSQVQVMGIDVGTVKSVTPVNGTVRVVAEIDENVPLPATANAAIVPLSLIGERTLTFAPAWRPGMPRLADGAVLRTERTQVPVEVNEALQSFGRLIDSFDPAKADAALGTAAGSLDGNGAAFNQAFQEAGQLMNNLAGKDERLLEIARNLNRLAGVVKGREKTLGELVEHFSQASTMLASERQSIRTLVQEIADLVERGEELIDKYRNTLPGDLAKLAQLSLMIQGNADRLGRLLQALPGIGFQFVNAYNPEKRSITLRVTLDNFLRSYVAAILHEPTINENVPCPLPPPYSNCQ